MGPELQSLQTALRGALRGALALFLHSLLKSNRLESTSLEQLQALQALRGSLGALRGSLQSLQMFLHLYFLRLHFFRIGIGIF